MNPEQESPTPESCDALWAKVAQEKEQNKYPCARNQLVETHMGLVKSTLLIKFGRASDAQISAGYVGLIKAVEKYNPNANVLFSTFARKWIIYSAVDELKLETQLVKDSFTYEDIDDIPLANNCSTEHAFADQEILNALSKDERLIIEKKMEGYSLEEIATMLRQSSRQVTKMLKRIKAKATLNLAEIPQH